MVEYGHLTYWRWFLYRQAIQAALLFVIFSSCIEA